MDEDSLVIREEKIATEKAIKKRGFSVVVLHGPGGTGKTSLIRMTKDSLIQDEYLPIYIKGSKKEVDNHVIVKLTEVFTTELLTAAKLAGLKERDFPHLKKAIKKLNAFDDFIQDKFRDELDEDARNVVKLCDYLSLRLADLIYMSRADTLVSNITIDDRVRSSIESQANKIIRREGFAGIENLAQRWDILSDAVTQDFKQLLKSRHNIIGRKRYHGAVIILDNYEYLSRFLRIFLEQHMIPFFEGTNLNIKLLLVSRDSIDDFPETNVKNIGLGPFTNNEAKQFLKANGIVNEDRQTQIIRRSMRYPYLMDFEIMSSSQSAKSLQKYFDRITRWMTEQQKDWLVALSYLSHVDKVQIRKVVRPQDVDLVMEWFKNEPSVRCSETGRWKIIPLICEKVHAHIAVEDPDLDRELRTLATEKKVLKEGGLDGIDERAFSSEGYVPLSEATSRSPIT